MKVKRPAILFLSTYIIGILVAYSSIPIFVKVLIGTVAIFLYLKLYFEKKLYIKTLFVIFAFFIIGYIRFSQVEKKYDSDYIKIESIGRGNKNITGKVTTIGNSTNSSYVDLKNVTVNGMNLGNARLYFRNENLLDIKIGNSIIADAAIYTFEDPMNEGEFNQKNYYRSNGISFSGFASNIEITNSKFNNLLQKIYEIKISIKQQIHKIFNYKDAGLFMAMVTGDRSQIDKEQKRLYTENGIAHIIAISGLHLSILGLLLYEILRRFLSQNISAFFVSIFIVIYGIFIDASATSLRAITMLLIRFLSLSFGRTYDSKNTLYIICFIFLIIEPYLLFSAGFQFSYIAIFALNSNVEIPNPKYIYEQRKKIIRLVDSNKESKFIKKIDKKKMYLKIPPIIVMTFFLFPITIFHYFTYPLYSILINIVVVPLMTFVLVFGLCGLMISFFNITVGTFATYVVHLIFNIYSYLCKFTEKLPYHILWTGKPNLYEIFYYYLSIFLIIFAIRNLYIAPKLYDKLKNSINNIKFRLVSYKILNYIRLTLCILLFVLSILILSIRKKDDFRMTFISIGQGDSILVESKDILFSIDGGSNSNKSNGEYILAPHIKSRAIRHIDYAFVTHADSDHTNGLIYLLESEDDIELSNLVLPLNAKTDTKFSVLKSLASKKGANLLYMKEGDKLNVDDYIQISILSPDEESVNDIKFDQNELSLTFKLKYKNHSCLFTGDIGEKTMNRMISDEYVLKNMDVDVLKVPHHGSKNSNLKEFFDAVSAEYAVVSYGKNNTYGHPSSETVNSLIESGTKVLKTGASGQIDIYFDKDNVWYKTYK